MKYAFIKSDLEEYPVIVCCDVLAVSRSGYYAWLNSKPSQYALSNEQLDIKLIELYNEHEQRAGSPRLTRELNALGYQCSENQIGRAHV